MKAVANIIKIIFEIISGLASLYSASISRRVENGIEKFTHMQSYNKNRKSMTNKLKECKVYLTDKDLDIDLTAASEIQECIHRIKQYQNILKLNRNERRKIDKVLKLIIEGDCNSTRKRAIILDVVTYFIAKLEEKGEIYV